MRASKSAELKPIVCVKPEWKLSPVSLSLSSGMRGRDASFLLLRGLDHSEDVFGTQNLALRLSTSTSCNS